MRIAVVIGVRPHYLKLSAMYPFLAAEHDMRVINTGQHFDHEMSGAFVEELEMSPPDVNLAISTGSAVQRLASSIASVEPPLRDARPDLVMVIGDADPALVGALAAAQLGFPVGHVEAGLRSFDAELKEEANRRVIDALAAIHLCPTSTAARNMAAESRGTTAFQVGDLLLDLLDRQRPLVEERTGAWRERIPDLGDAAVVTLHRASTIHDATRLTEVISGLLTFERPLVFVLHPGTRERLVAAALLERLAANPSVTILGPQRHADLLALIAGADRVVSDSSGVQREALFLGTPCFIVRAATEYPETIDLGGSRLVGTDAARIAAASTTVLSMPPPRVVREAFGEGSAGPAIAGVLASVQRVR